MGAAKPAGASQTLLKAARHIDMDGTWVIIPYLQPGTGRIMFASIIQSRNGKCPCYPSPTVLRVGCHIGYHIASPALEIIRDQAQIAHQPTIFFPYIP